MTKRPEVTRRRTRDPGAVLGADTGARTGPDVLRPMAAEPEGRREPRFPRFAIPIDTLAEYVGATAVISGGLLLAGLWSTAAYLSAWGIPVWLVALDPLATALRSDSAVYLGLLAAVVALVPRALERTTSGRGRVLMTALALIASVVVTTALVALGALGVAIAVGGGALTFAVSARGLVRERGMAGLIVAVAIVAGYQASATMGERLRDDPPAATRVAITTLSPVAGLDGGSSNERGWEYRDLIVFFRDNNSIYVSRPGSGTNAWIIPNANVMSVGIGAE